MILCIDIGNTNIKYGIFNGEKLVASFRVTSQRNATSDEYGVIVRDLLMKSSIKNEEIRGIIMSSVIPQLNYTMEHMCLDYFGFKPIEVEAGLKTGMNIRVDSPKQVGADRIVNSISAIRKYGAPCIVIDFGTATTFNAINGKGELIGGAIAPGMKSSLDSLVFGTAKLPNIELEKPKKVICTNTIENMQAGIIYGFAGLVEYIVKKMKEELGSQSITVIGTGGLGEIIAKEAKCIDVVDRMLTLNGLKILYDMNSAQ